MMDELLSRLRAMPRSLNDALRTMDEAADCIEALEAALQKLTEDPPATLDEPDPDFVVINKMRKIARAALDKDEEK